MQDLTLCVFLSTCALCSFKLIQHILTKIFIAYFKTIISIIQTNAGFNFMRIFINMCIVQFQTNSTHFNENKQLLLLTPLN